MSLTGRILPIGGVKEKLLAARRSDVKTVLFPEDNRKDYDELKGAQIVLKHVEPGALLFCSRRQRCRLCCCCSNLPQNNREVPGTLEGKLCMP